MGVIVGAVQEETAERERGSGRSLAVQSVRSRYGRAREEILSLSSWVVLIIYKSFDILSVSLRGSNSWSI
jgi:hypothetical protein